MPKSSPPCPITREEFRTKAQTALASVEGTTVVLAPKECSTGSLGWYATGKVLVEVAGYRLLCQVGINLTVVGSKDAR